MLGTFVVLGIEKRSKETENMESLFSGRETKKISKYIIKIWINIQYIGKIYHVKSDMYHGKQ